MRAQAALVALSLFATPAFAEKLWTERNVPARQVDIPSLSPLVRQVSEAVLTINVEGAVENVSGPGRADPRMDLFRRFGFEFRGPQMPPMHGQGTGFLIHPEGYALTNNHVIENAAVIRVRVGSDHREYEAEVVGSDPNTDVALIKLKSKRKDWPVIPLGDSDRLSVGDFVVAIGNPFGLSQSVSMGIISARGRRDIAPSGRQGLYNFLQTDASINPGNSGGPLINLSGEVIGINTAINSAGQGIGFAIPVNLVKKLVPELKQNGRIARSWIGVGIRPVAPDLADGFGLDRPRGALVAQVVPGGPADKGGLRPGDIITKFDGKPIEEASELPLLAGLGGVGKKVRLEVLRDGKVREHLVTLGQLPSEDGVQRGRGRPSADDEQIGRLGVTVESLDDNTRSRLRLPAEVRGALVVNVAPGSVAAEAGLEPGDVVVEVNGSPVRTARAFAGAVKKVPSGKLVRILLRRGDATIFTALVKP